VNTHCVAYEWYANGVIDITRVHQTNVQQTATGCCERNVAYFRPFKSSRTPPHDGRLATFQLHTNRASYAIDLLSLPPLVSPVWINRDVHPDLEGLFVQTNTRHLTLCNENLSSLLASSNHYIPSLNKNCLDKGPLQRDVELYCQDV